MPQELILPREYQTLLGALKERIRSAQLQALRYVNREQIDLYNDIGRMIVEKQQGETWGKSIAWLKILAGSFQARMACRPQTSGE